MTQTTLQDWYQNVPFQSLPFRCTHPDALSVQAMFAGLNPTPSTNSRILEIGCASGGNLLPMCQTLPDAQFVGLDLSPQQINTAADLAHRANLHNVTFHCTDLANFSDSRSFDYIIAHGIYSWVTPAAQDHLLKLCDQLLSPNGIACISYNTFPGWHVRGMLRQMMLQAIQTSNGELTSIALASRAREIADSLAKASRLVDPIWGSLVQLAVDAIRSRSDDQLLHDDLEPFNHPVYFHEFCEHAERHQLKYLCPADPACEPGNRLPPTIQAELSKLSDTPLKKEQYLDVILNRAHRESILCRASAPLHKRPPSEILKNLWLASNLKPTQTPHSATDKILHRLYHTWPNALPAANFPEVFQEPVTTQLLSLFSNGSIEFWPRPCDFVGSANNVPPLAKLQAAAGGPVTNLRHQALQFDPDILAAIAGDPENRSPAQIHLLTWHSLLLD